jgi:hypothetical protein
MEKITGNMVNLYAMILQPDPQVFDVTFNSWGETLLYMPIIEEGAKLMKRLEAKQKNKIHNHLYTNGVLATHDVLEKLKEWGIIEIRFHPSASNFSKKVLNNIRTAKEMGFVVTIEEPALNENRDSLMEHLPLFQEIGINHLDIVECQYTEHNRKYLDSKYPKGRIYQDRLWHVYDEGLVYDIIEYVLKEGYEYSVIDCNSQVEVCRSADHHYMPELINWESMDDAIRRS